MRVPRETRHARIIAALDDSSALRVSELARQFGVTTETIRRDFAALSEDGRVNRTYGGVVSAGGRFEPELQERLRLNARERQLIAQHAVDLFEENDALLLGGGATMLRFARCLKRTGRRLVVITPCLSVARELAVNSRIEVMVLPGVLDSQEQIVTGPVTLEAIANYRVPVAIIGASGVSRDGVSEAMPGIGDVYQALIESADRLAILADHGKFEKRALMLLAEWGPGMSLVTDMMPGSELAAAIQGGGAEIIVPPASAG